MRSILTFMAVLLLSAATASGQETLSLQACVDTALNNNLDVKQSQLTRQSRELTYEGNQANYLPSLNLGMRHQFNFGRSVDLSTNQFRTQRTTINQPFANANMTIFDGLATPNNVSSSRHAMQASAYDIEAVKNNISMQVASAYLGILMNRETVRRLESQVKTTQELYKQAKLLVEAGTATKDRELQLGAQLATEEANLIQAENSLQASYLQLKQVMNIDPRREIVIEDPNLGDTLSVMPSYELADGINNIANLPEMKSAEQTITASRYAYRAARGGYLPSITLSASANSFYSTANQQFAGYDPNVTTSAGTFIVNGQPLTLEQPVPIFEDISFGQQMEENFGQSISATLTIPIFNKFQVRNAVQNAQIQQAQAEVAHAQTRNQLQNTITQAYNDMTAARKNYEAMLKAMQAQKLLFEQMKLRYDVGASNYFDFINAKNSYTLSEVNFLSAKYDYVFKTKVFEFYAGMGLRF